MTISSRSLPVLLLLVTVLLALPVSAVAADQGWVCPPCGHVDLDTTYPEPGDCPICGMALVERSELVYVAILVFDGVQIIDYTAPWEIFGQAGFYVYAVSPDGKPVTTTMGMEVTPQFSIEDAPEANIVVVPGGMVHTVDEDQSVLDWIGSTSATADTTLSVCNGAFLLAKAGLLDGKSATTFYGLLDEFEEQFPDVKTVRDQRYVDNGSIITTAGLSSGIDGSLYVIERMRGRGAAERLALHLEYQWDPESTFARAALADRQLPDIELPDGAEISVRDLDGDRDRWMWLWDVSTDLDRAALAEYLDTQLLEAGWTKIAVEPATSGAQKWRFAGRDGAPWTGETVIEPTETNHYDVRVEIERSAATAAAASGP